MGAERFFDIKCPTSGLRPDAAVVVATVRALKVHSGHHRVTAGRPLPDALLQENPDEVHEGAANLRKQIENIQQFGVPAVVAINAFPTDHPSEWHAVAEVARSMGVRVAISDHFARGGRGAMELAEAVADACTQSPTYAPLYPSEAQLPAKIETIARRVYGADGVDYTPAASAELERYERLGWGRLPVCVAKTHLSISSDAQLRGAPRGWRLPVREVRAAVGAGYVYVICGDMQTMPGLGAHPALENIDLDSEGNAVGLTQSHVAP
jgi:formate--tetrahydrofolate ligase